MRASFKPNNPGGERQGQLSVGCLQTEPYDLELTELAVVGDTSALATCLVELVFE